MKDVFHRLIMFVPLALSACAVGPDYVEPAASAPESWTQGEDASSFSNAEPEVQWWTTFNDATLDSLIQQAVQSNLDLEAATARVREARAQRGVVTGEGNITIDANGSYTRFRRSQESGGASSGAPATGTGGSGSQGAGSSSLEGDSFQGSFDAAWELDVFGGIRRSVNAADADIQAAQESRHDVLVTLLGDVARNYIELRFFQKRLDIAQRNIGAQQASLEVAQARFDAGLTSELDVAQAKSLLATTTAVVPALEASRDQAIHRLGILLGQWPGSLMQRLQPSAEAPSAPPIVPVGLPSDLLRQRPDIRQAERQLAAATERIGVATADLYPKFQLTGNIGVSASDFADLFQSSAGFWNVGPSITWPILEGGRIHANIQVAEARAQESLIAYQQSILGALQEVEDNLVAYAKERIRLRSLDAAVTANRRAVDLANDRYTKGLVDFQSVLDTQRSLFLAEDDQAQSQRTVSISIVAIYKALGGGWSAFTTVDGETGESWGVTGSDSSEPERTSSVQIRENSWTDSHLAIK
ncbi:MAG TPA: efflux transporter outer membrane subunit [Phycisphaerales bacterium]|nr:efflux transporter outer membrane subunit [Phycisphaerales bacterium]